MPTALRLSASAPRVIAAAIFFNPYVRLGVGIASLLYTAKMFWDDSDQKWKQRVDEDQVIVRWEYRLAGVEKSFDSPEAACTWFLNGQAPRGATVVFYGASVPACRGGFSFPYEYLGNPPGYVFGGASVYNIIERVQKPCPAGSEATDEGCVVKGSRTETVETSEEFARRVLNPANQVGWPNVPADWPLPSSVPGELPANTPLPVEKPVINPGQDGKPSPLFIPTGSPIPNPKYDPSAAPGPGNQPWIQPGFRVVPAPTPDDPWRVDIQPVDRPLASPDDDPNAEPNPGDQPKPEDQQSLCEKHPDIVACQKLGEIEAKPLPANVVPLKLEREEGFGPSNGSCPAPRHLSAMGMDLEFRWDLFCDFASGVRPLIVGFAYLAAVLSFLGLSRKD
ncbi:hypothetical protein AVHY2522_20985 [Acidovorax sp. SUPP2522]|uniref:virulence factor TspB C-terminal domain-related protein n=1 Tax=unclassified Acidovorax TaxID=2684926 RepID=UPI002349DB3A|nr:MULTISPECIES: virulence factor TspB C-terminal domain-related protein [unclassified Acidovorax]WCM96651.1 hypothetical protein M5C96_19820 [Acidovorax sp. GBBC 1281]GKT19024.1 hypothetical protein AVHY2522_20985 [Acidovorax sp. SUPP2522]